MQPVEHPMMPPEALRRAADLLEQGRSAPTAEERQRAYYEARDLATAVLESMAAADDPIIAAAVGARWRRR